MTYEDEKTIGNNMVKQYIEESAKQNNISISNLKHGNILGEHKIVHQFNVNDKQFKIEFTDENIHDCANDYDVQSFNKRRVEHIIKAIKQSSSLKS